MDMGAGGGCAARSAAAAAGCAAPPMARSGGRTGRRLLALPVGDRVLGAEEGAQPPAARQPLAHADLAGVRIHHHVGPTMTAYGQEGDRSVRAVRELMRAVLAERKPHRLPGHELALALGRPERRTAGQHDHHLLVGVVEVVRIGGLAWRELPQAAADQLAAELVSDAYSAGAEACWPLLRLEVRFVDVGHGYIKAASSAGRPTGAAAPPPPPAPRCPGRWSRPAS